MEQQERFLRVNEVLEMIPVAKSTFYAKVKQGVFPKPIKFGRKLSMWRESDIRNFIQNYK